MQKFNHFFERYIWFPQPTNIFSFQLYLKKHLVPKLLFSWLLKLIIISLLIIANIAYVLQIQVSKVDLTYLTSLVTIFVIVNFLFYFLYFFKLDFNKSIKSNKHILYTIFLLTNLILWICLHFLSVNYLRGGYIAAPYLLGVFLILIFYFDIIFLISPYFLIKRYDSKQISQDKILLLKISKVKDLKKDFYCLSYDSDFWKHNEKLNSDILFFGLGTDLTFHLAERELTYFYIFKYKEELISIEVSLSEKCILKNELKEFLTQQIINSIVK